MRKSSQGHLLREVRTSTPTSASAYGNDFGLRRQRLLETGGFLVGDEVGILVDVSAVKADDE